MYCQPNTMCERCGTIGVCYDKKFVGMICKSCLDKVNAKAKEAYSQLFPK